METLIETKRRGDYVHHLVKRNDHVAIYDTTLDDEIIGYEVFLIRKQKPRTVTMAGKSFELIEKELFPTDEMFGYDAFAPGTREKAEEYFDALTQRVEMAKRGLCMN